MCWCSDPIVTAGGTATNQDTELPPLGTPGEAVTDLFPSGEVSINSKRYQARVEVGSIERGSRIRVSGIEDFSLVVEAAKS